MSGLLAVVVVRDGAVPAGADETVAECGGHALLCLVGAATPPVGTGASAAADPDNLHDLLAQLPGVSRVWTLSAPAYAPGAIAAGIAAHVAGGPAHTAVTGTGARDLAGAASRGIVLPASPDGRDLAPRLARALGRPLYAGAVQVAVQAAVQAAVHAAVQVAPQVTGHDTSTLHLARGGGRQIDTVTVHESFVATLVPGVRGVAAPAAPNTPTVVDLGSVSGQPGHGVSNGASDGARADARVIEVLPPDAATMDLTEARRILCGGAGLDDAARFDQLGTIAASIGASVGATRVITDRGWIGHQRQIGTTGAVVNPDLYLAFGISGAVQHTSGLGQPDHIVSVNTDPHCPMMQMADLAIVSDANAVLDELMARLAGTGELERAALSGGPALSGGAAMSGGAAS